MSDNKELSNEEIALYDRQIRLWGLDAQKRIKTANILLINLSAVGTEIAKNLVLGGIGSLSMIDSHDISEEDLGAQFYISEDAVGEKRLLNAQANIQDLNPRVKLQVFTEDVSTKDAKWFSQFNLVISTELSHEENLRINEITRSLQVPFYATGLHGLFGYIFVDLIQHVATYKKQKSNIPTKPGKVYSFSEIVEVAEVVENEVIFENITTKDTFKSYKDFSATFSNKGYVSETYATKRKLKRITPILPLTLAALSHSYVSTPGPEQLLLQARTILDNLSFPKSILEGKDELVETFLLQLNNEFAPVSAIVGGALAQDVINTLGKKGKPLNNFVVLDGISGDMPIFTI